jgi:NAD(P)-dependent dehydrogenase (short-subunit alcohol dehydrogenase family)
MHVVITGSTRGIGLALARAFFARGCSVVVSGRSEDAVREVVRGFDSPLVIGRACDVTDARQVQALWDAAVDTFGSVDRWINNAGTSNRFVRFAELELAEIDAVIGSNLRGTMNGSYVALRGMLKQERGQIFNMEGWGSKGEHGDGMLPYTTSKRAIRYFTDSLAREYEGAPICIGTLQPGMVLTDLLESSWAEGAPSFFLARKRLFHFVVDPADEVCGWLADRVIENRRSGAHIAWMTPLRLLPRFFMPRYWRRNPFAGSKLDRIGA